MRVAILLMAPLLISSPTAISAPLKLKMRQKKRPAPKLKLVSARLLELEIARDNKGLRVLGHRRIELRKAKALPRFRGRFELRLYSHKRLREVVSFSFPLTLAAGEPSVHNRRLSRQMREGVRARTKVRIPWTADLTHLLLVDPSGAATRYALPKAAPLPRNLPGPKRTDALGR